MVNLVSSSNHEEAYGDWGANPSVRLDLTDSRVS